jgi:hypothetical protein
MISMTWLYDLQAHRCGKIVPAPPFGIESVQASEPICDPEFHKYLTLQDAKSL